jgi:hypothetical protein
MTTVPINKLTGAGNGFYTAFMGKGTQDFTGAPPAIQNESLLSHILQYMPASTEGVPMTVYSPESIIKPEHQEEMLGLLRLGLGAVAADKTIWLAQTLVGHAYANDAAKLRTLLNAMIRGRLAALTKTRPKNDAIDLTRRIDEEISELEGLLAKLGP